MRLSAGHTYGVALRGTKHVLGRHVQGGSAVSSCRRHRQSQLLRVCTLSTARAFEALCLKMSGACYPVQTASVMP